MTLAGLAATLLLFSLAACLLAFLSPPDQWAIDTLRCAPQTAQADGSHEGVPVTLPYKAPLAGPSAPLFTLCQISLTLPAPTARNPVLYIPSYADELTVTLNGQRMAQVQRHQMRDLRFATQPAFIPLSSTDLQEGANTLRLTLSSLPGRNAFLDHLYLADEDALLPYFHARWLATVLLPTLGVGGGIAFAIVFALLWIARPAQREFAWLSATLLLGSLRGSLLVPDFGLASADRPLWNMLSIWEVTTGMLFCRAIAYHGSSRREWLWFLPPLLLSLVFLLGRIDLFPTLLIPATMLLAFVYLAAAVRALAVAARQGNQDALILLLGLLMICAFIARDFLMVLRPGPNLFYLTRTMYSGLLIAIAMLMTMRFTRALYELDQSATVLRERVAATQETLRRTYEELRERREAQAIEQERARLMRDLHDGLGGNLVTMLALADAPQTRPGAIADQARAALTDMRLIISSLEDYGGDLSLALGAWRERAEPQLRAAGLALAWQVRDVPAIASSGPAQMLDILRIVQEAVTNAIKHARASTVTVATEGSPEGVVLSIQDDGQGCDSGVAESIGNGMRNMQARAARLGARLDIRHDAAGTRVRLVLPYPPILAA